MISFIGEDGGCPAYQANLRSVTSMARACTLTLARKRRFATFAHAGGGGLVRPPPGV